MKAEHRESDDILNEHQNELQKELDYIKGKNHWPIDQKDMLFSPLKLTYISALNCDLKELPVIQGILKQIKSDNPGFFWPAHHPPPI